MGTAVDLERNGLCVVCQDEEANIAVVDCGYVFVTVGVQLHTTNGRLVFLQPFGDVPQLLRSHYVFVARMPALSYPHRDRCPSPPHFQDMMVDHSALNSR
jgi:hypothetical protein